MGIRNRESSVPGPAGSLTLQGSAPTRYTSTQLYKTCVDVIGNYNGQNPLEIEEFRIVNPPVLNGTYGFWTYSNCPVSSATAPFSPRVSSYPGGGPSYRQSRNEAAANSHPGEPAISLPNFLFELRELPAMYKTWMHRLDRHWKTGNRLWRPRPKRLDKESANLYLEYQFAWQPLFSDLANLFEVSEWCARRAAYIAKAQNDGFIRRRIPRGSHSATYTDNNFPYNSRGGNMWGVAVHEFEATNWITTRWKHNGNLPLSAFLSQQRHQLMAAALGLELSFQTIWDAIPWSWMVDYFTDLSSVISVHRNRAGFRFAGACEMETLKLTSSITPRALLERGPTPYTRVHTTKRRTPFSPTLSDVGINFLNARQLSILGALNVSRIHGRSFTKTN